jgi:hypothetical protein
MTPSVEVSFLLTPCSTSKVQRRSDTYLTYYPDQLAFVATNLGLIISL